MKKLLISLFLLSAVRLLAVSPVPYTETVSFSFKISGTGSASMNLYDESGSQYILATASGSTIESAMAAANLRPGKTYSLEFWGDGPPDYLMSFVPPTGYSVYVNGVQTDLVGQSPGSGWFLHYYTVEIRPTSSTGGGMWGNFSGVSLGKSITWEVGLGDLRTGRSAGSILFKELDLANSPASRSRLYYAAPPANVGQIVVIKDGPSNQTLRQIVTPIGFTDIVDDASGNFYTIKFYFWNQVASWNGTLYTFTGSPWKTIKVESPANNELKITETEGSVVRVSLLKGSGSTSNTGGTISYAGNNTLHTFTSGGTLSVGSALSGVSWLVVGGGGGGGSHNNGGGGGGGSVEYLTGQSLAATNYTVVVGAGGAADTNGSNSTFNGTTAYGGGHGASASAGSAATSGGSGGGGWTNGGGAGAGSGSNVRAGGGGDNGGSAWQGGGGGGADSSQNQSQGGGTYTGGAGLANSITGSAIYYAGGGGGGSSGGTPMSGGLGGGGAGGTAGSTSGVAGGANTGGGGGGSATSTAGSGGAGGSGVVIVRYPTPTMTWTLQEGNSTNCVRTTVQTITFPASGQRDAVAAVYTTTGTYASPTNTLVAKTKYHYVNQSWGGEELESSTADPDASNPSERTTTYTYHTTSSNKGNYRLVKSVTAPTGGWTAYEYYDDWDRRGRVKYQFQPWLDAPSAASSASTTTGRVIYHEYTTDWTGRYTRPTLREERINNTVTGKTTWTHGDNTGSGEPRAYATIRSYRDASNYHTDYVENYRADADPDFAGRPYMSQGANLTQVSTSISRGTFNTTTKAFVVGSSGDHWRELKFNGSLSSGAAGSTLATGFDGQACSWVYMIPNQTTMDVTIRIAQGYVYRTETWVWTGSGGTDGFHLVTSEDFDYDATGNLTQRWAHHNGALTGYTYTNGRLTSTTDPTGTETQFTYDEIGRVATSVKKGASAGTYAAQSDITTTYTYDGANHVTQTVTGSSPSLTASSAYDLAGRLSSTTAPGSYTTSYDYTIGPRTSKVTLPGGAYQTTENYYDGQPKSLTGTAVVAQAATFARDGTSGLITRTVKFGGSTTALVDTTTDWLGRPVTEVKPSPTGSGNVTSSWFYNGANQLYKFTQPGLANQLYTYDTLGSLVREGLDIGANGTLDLASSDRITDHAWTFFTASSNWWRRQTTSTYATTSSGTATSLGKSETQLTGLPTNRLSRTDTTDIFGNVTSQFVDVNRSGKLVTTTTDAPDSTTDAVSIAYNGLPVSSRSTANLTTTFGYDALGRQTTSVDPRTGTTTKAYVSGTSQVATVTDPASIVQATYTYDSAGRVSSVKDALNKYAYTSYTTRGEVYRQWGDTTYPVEYGYDNWGRRTTMKTYRGGTGWTGSTWPGSPGTPDVTKWIFDEPTGLLKEKYDAANLDANADPISGAKKVSYTYTQAGQLATRTWARGTVTTYGYSSTTAERLTVDYSDSTPDLTYTYNRLGHAATVTDVTGTRTFNYSLSGTLELQNEILGTSSGDFCGDRRITRGYDTATGVVGRYKRLSVGSSTNAYADYDLSYGFDGYGRLNSSYVFNYTYLANSHLIQSVAYSGWNYTDTRAYDATHDWTDSRTTTISSTTKAAFAYAQDNLGRVSSVAKTGEIYNRYGNGTEGLKIYYGYDDRSQLTSEVTKIGTSSTVLTGRDDAYAFDNLGNRSSTAGTTHNSNTANYTTNALNQYTQRTVPGVFDVAGAAGSGTTVTVNSSSTGVTRHGEYFFKGHGLSNSPNAVFSTLVVSDGTTTTNIGAFLAGTPEAFIYDDDGNLLSDGRWDCTYDAENRLVSMQTHTALSPSPLANADARRIEFKNDYLGRRVQKTVRGGWNGSTFTTVILDLKNLYDGWNLLFEFNAASSLAKVRAHIWGLDVSGTLQGAGGVGGLLYTYDFDNAIALLPMYDAMGNNHGMIKATDGSLAAVYEYDAFGNTLRESGTYAATNPWR
ncbi:MAG: hypothetical protein PSU94_10515, partial [Lacunisphaera sp.]|nr:hypothetical protein [Lacunisphaera sp.]